jgi:putative heme-binding domain-containing protein
LNLRAGSDRGRIYRLVRTDAPPRKLSPLDKLGTKELVAKLDSPSGTRRDLVQQMLLWRGDREAAEPLATLARDAKLPQVRWQALCTLDGLNALTPESIVAALQDDDAGVRLHGARLAETLLKEHPELGKELAKLADDSDLRVQWQVAWTLGAWNDPAGGEVLAKLAAEHGSDPYFALAILGSLRDVHRANFLVKCLQRREAFAAWFESSLTQAIENREYATIKRLVRELDERIEADPALAFRALEMILAKLERQPWPNARFVDEQGAIVMHKLFNLAEKVLPSKDAKLEERIAAAQLLGQQFSAWRTLERVSYYNTLRKIAEDEHAAEELRATALRSLSNSPDIELPTWERFFTPQTPLVVQEAYLAAVRVQQKIENLTDLLADWRSRTPSQRAQILDALLASPEGCTALLSAISRQQIAAQQLDAARRARLIDHPEEAIRKRAQNVLRDVTDLDRAKVLASFSDLLDKPGDVARGKAVFTKRCSQCHRHAGIGHAVGPELASLTDKSPQAFLTAMLDPNRAVEDKFQSYLLVTTDGRIITGIIANETGTSITLIEPEGKTHDILRKEIDTLYSSGKSLMPEGLERDMPKEEFADVIAYLRAAPPKTFEGNEPALVKPEADKKLLLKATNASIHGPTLVFEAKYQNLGFWQSEDDYAAWSVEVPRAGKYRVTLDYACDESTAGDRFSLTIGDQLLSGKVTSTGTRDDYREVDLGELELPAGTHEAVFRSLGGIRSALLDLRTVRLTPGL